MNINDTSPDRQGLFDEVLLYVLDRTMLFKIPDSRLPINRMQMGWMLGLVVH